MSEFPQTTDVLVVGAGPAGLTLAAELALNDVDVVIIDRLPRATGQSRALGFTARTIELFVQRGIIDRFPDMAQQDAVHFGGLVIDADRLSTSARPANQYPQSRTEEVLTARLEELGVMVQRDQTAHAISQSSTEVVTSIRNSDGTGKDLTTNYVVGCDGSNSLVRTTMEVSASTTAPSVQMLLGDVRGADLPNNPFGTKLDRGMVMSAPLGNGDHRLIVCDFGAPFIASGREVSPEDLRHAYQNVTADRFPIAEIVWASSFTDASRIVDNYVDGRLILVGDSAHTHLPAGGQGMNVSIQDAVNLGWKLAAVVQGRLPSTFLSTYDEERRPVGLKLLRNTAAQGQIFLKGPEVDPLREVISSMLENDDTARVVADSVSGLDVEYKPDPTESSDLTGKRLPLGSLRVLGTQTDCLELLSDGGFLLVTLDDVPRDDLPLPSVSQLKTVRAVLNNPFETLDLALIDALLLRPDGHIAWTSSSTKPLFSAIQDWIHSTSAPQDI
ncbi:FAD-dependent monooxygenase [Rhodococcus sp. H29-C3]|uniref:FAD-dependent monooxygenase n=1 Tax=Rhodococcus sp. H29-C3 TaxID=3046307 RepID=UPI0024BAD323|nr:FAD-dependent monooxygenase [Rhodococcus sp. H29-C3]MDJ0362347.1 FAD-dependent monooxygenase [Rhodococcus sp. H29-C3]